MTLEGPRREKSDVMTCDNDNYDNRVLAEILQVGLLGYDRIGNNFADLVSLAVITISTTFGYNVA